MDMIKTVIRIDNDMVTVFDENGEEMPEYHGCFNDVKDKILADVPADAVFKRWFGRVLKPETISMEPWEKYDFPETIEIIVAHDINK
jgi:hypothetical protein